LGRISADAFWWKIFDQRGELKEGKLNGTYEVKGKICAKRGKAREEMLNIDICFEEGAGGI
jgi:hypothetical protein